MTTKKKSFEVHGHRGARAIYPENTLESFRYALGEGADAVEVDVALTSDKVAILIHDSVLSATHYQWKDATPLGDHHSKLVKDLSFSEVQKLDAGILAHTEFPKQKRLPGASIPTLEDFVKLMMSESDSAILNIEIKTHPIVHEATLDPEDFIDVILGILHRYKVPRERVLFQSFDPRPLLILKGREPLWKVSFLVDAWSDDVPELAVEMGFDAVSPRWDLLNHDVAKSLRDAGLGVYVWTANRSEDWKTLSEIGVDAIITDDPASCLAFRNAADKSNKL